MPAGESGRQDEEEMAVGDSFTGHWTAWDRELRAGVTLSRRRLSFFSVACLRRYERDAQERC